MPLVDFFYAANGAKTIQDLSRFWLSFLDEFGLDRFMMCEMSSSSDEGAHKFDLMVNYPREWLDHYQTNRYENHDPVFLMGIHEQKPFTWETAISRYRERKSRMVMHEARDFGLLNGVGLSFRPSCGRLTGIGFSSSHKEILCGPVDLRILNAASIEFYTCYANLAGGAETRINLTERETEVLRWIAAGKTKTEVADILCVSGACIKRHCESAFRKLDVNSLAYAVARAIGLGLIDPP